LSGAVGQTAGDWRQNPSLYTQFQQNTPISYDFSKGTLPLVNTPSMSGDELYADPSLMKLSALSIADKAISDDEDFAQADFTYFIDDSLFTAIKMGVKYRSRINATTSLLGKVANSDRAGYTMDQFLVDPYTDFEHPVEGGATSNIPDFSTQLIMEGPGALASELSEEGKWTENWSIEEETTAAYVRVDLEGENYRANFGVRYVETDQENNGHNADGTDAFFSRTYSDTLPSANITFDVSDDFLIRAGYAKTMARPSMADLNDGETVNLGAGTIKKGNSELDPFRADQFDLSAEWYFEEGGLISAALFHKDIESFVTGVQYDILVPGDPDPETGESGDRSFLVTSLDNGPGATVTGIELSHQQNYTSLPGFLSGLGSLVNYTYTDSDTEFKDADGMDRNLPMPGLSENTLNAILFYVYEDFSSRIAYNYRDKFVTFADGLGGLPIYRSDVVKVDFSLTYKMPKTSFAITFDATNLTDDETHDYAGSKERLVAYHTTGRHFGLSVRYNFL
jgi:iron complex outermembrane receptor protein